MDKRLLVGQERHLTIIKGLIWVLHHLYTTITINCLLSDNKSLKAVILVGNNLVWVLNYTYISKRIQHFNLLIFRYYTLISVQREDTNAFSMEISWRGRRSNDVARFLTSHLLT